MITLKELLSGNKISDLTPIQQDNINVLLERIYKVRALWGKPMTVTSGFRSSVKHAEIYAKKGVAEDKIPWGSCHLSGSAVDIYDPNDELENWLKANPQVLIDAQLWCEDQTDNWVHFQIKPPASGSRWFKA